MSTLQKYFLLSLLLVGILSAGSIFNGKYICNGKQVLKITTQNLYIGNGIFKYYRMMNRSHVGEIVIFLKGNEVAMFSRQPEWKGHYSLNIHNLQSKNEAPYVGDCILVK